jgi:hypothetical protein
LPQIIVAHSQKGEQSMPDKAKKSSNHRKLNYWLNATTMDSSGNKVYLLKPKKAPLKKR